MKLPPNDLPIFVINLQRSTKRRELMCRQLDGLGLRYRLFEGTDGNQLTDAQIAEICEPEACTRWGLTRGKIGCVYTKYRLYRTMVDEGIEQALVLEDDLLLSPDLPALLPRLQAELQPDEILLLLGLPDIGCQFSSQDVVTIRDKYQLRYPMNPHKVVSATAFMLTLPVAERLAELLLPVRTCSDWWGVFHDLGAFRSLRCLCPSPVQLALEQPSEIEARRQRHPALQALRGLIYRYNLFPFSHLLTWRRRRAIQRVLSAGSMTHERSPLALAVRRDD